MTEPAGIDLELELRVGEPAGRTVEVEVLRSPAGEATETTTLPFDTIELDNRLKDVQIALLGRSATTRRIVPEYERAVQEFGDLLFDTVFTGEVRSLLDRSREQAISQGVGLRVKLRFESADMASLPWEFLHDARRDEYLALSCTTPIVRHVELAEPQRPLIVTRPLHVLAMVASPTDLPALDVAQERARIDAAFAGLEGSIELHWIEGQTWRDLQTALQREKWHVFHFIGHGGFDARRGEGIVALCDDAGEAHNLGASDLGLLLGDHDSLRLTVLNSCDGARADKLDIFSSTAAVLVRKGTPAVIAMQYEITDRAAVELSRSFYTALARGLPVDIALTEARKAVALAFPGTVEWGTPVLHLRARDGRIFDVNADPQDRDVAPPPPAPPPPTGIGPPPSPAPQPAARPRRRSKALAIAAAVAAVLLIGGGVLFALNSGSKEEGATGAAADGTAEEEGVTVPVGADTGEEPIALDVSAGEAATYTVDVAPETVALVTAIPQDGLDVDLAAVTDEDTADALSGYTGAEYGHSFDAFPGYASVPPGIVVGRVDENENAPEHLAVLAPEGGVFDLVVVGAAETAGRVTLEIERIDVPAQGVDSTYLDRVVSDLAVLSTLTPRALDALYTTGAIDLPWTAVNGDDSDSGAAGDDFTVVVDVPGNVMWTNTGVDVAVGDSVVIDATGTIHHAVEDPSTAVGPDGASDDAVRNNPGLNEVGGGVYVNPPGHGGLIGKVGEDGAVNGVSSHVEVDNVTTAGTLYLGINDRGVGNNDGSFQATITVTR